jgi:hypothetical protein
MGTNFLTWQINSPATKVKFLCHLIISDYYFCNSNFRKKSRSLLGVKVIAVKAQVAATAVIKCQPQAKNGVQSRQSAAAEASNSQGPRRPTYDNRPSPSSHDTANDRQSCDVATPKLVHVVPLIQVYSPDRETPVNMTSPSG